MSKRETLTLSNASVRERLIEWAKTAPDKSRATLEGPKRTSTQSALMWVLLNQLEKKAKYHGLKLSAEDWKIVMMSGLKSEMRVVPNLDSNGMVMLDRASSRLSVSEMAMLIDIIDAWAAMNGVELTHKIPGYEDDERT